MTRNVIQNTRPSFTFWESLGTKLGGGGERGGTLRIGRELYECVGII